jgi:hypothetical protein
MSRRRRPNSASATKSSTGRVTPPKPRSEPALSALVDLSAEAHRLAVIACDNGGSVGSALKLFEQAAAKVAERPVPSAALSADAMRAEAERMRREIAEATALAEAGWALRDAEWKATVLRWRLQRSISAEQRRLERDRRREEGGFYANQPRSDGRPTRLAVDPEAFDFLKSYAIRRRTSVGYLVGQLVADAVSHSALPRGVRDDRCATQRFIRLIALDVETWTTFKAMALDAHVTSTRMVGALVEHEARRRGWRAEKPDEPAV